MSEPDFLIWVIPPAKPGGPFQVTMRTSTSGVPLSILMVATQYMMHLSAQGGAKSGEGYEKTLDSLMQGAMTWSHMGIVEQKEE